MMGKFSNSNAEINRTKILLKCLFVVFVVFIICTFYPKFDRQVPEPGFGGKSLDTWINQYYWDTKYDRGGGKEAKDAVVAIGTNAIPFLLADAAATDSKFAPLLSWLSRSQRFIRIPESDLRWRHYKAKLGFEMLGSNAATAVPELTRLVSNPATRETSIRCLGHIGPAAESALPILIPLADESNRVDRLDTVWTLGRIHAQPDLVVPLLIQNLRSTNSTPYQAMRSLENYGSDAKKAGQYLIPFLQHSDWLERVVATNALRAVDPETAAKYGIY